MSNSNMSRGQFLKTSAMLALAPSVLSPLGSEHQHWGIGPQSVPIDNVECLFDPAFRAKTATILSEKQARNTGVPLCLVRLANSKLAIMAKDKTGTLQPFYMKGIETSFWGTRKNNADYDVVFDAYHKMGANAAMFTIHWSDIEPEDGKFDFSLTDRIVAKAQRHGIKVVWALFMHEQFDMVPPILPPEDLWMYNLDTRDGANYAIQWIKDKNGDIIKDIATQRQKKFTEILPCYEHPIVYNRIIRMLGKLGSHYKNSASVIGVQIGNEEGISYQGSDADFNPYTIASFKRWKKKTKKTSWTDFKLAIVKLWWSRFTTTYHLKDPYKLTMLNLIGGGPEKGETDIIARNGTDVTTFRDSKIDAIATMFYGPDASRIWDNLDQIYKVNDTYSYPTQLPILMSTEIGIRNADYTQEYMINFLKRGSQGFAVFAYDSMANENGVINDKGDFYQKFMSMVKANEDIIWAGLPGAGDISIYTTTEGATEGAKVSCLHKDHNGTLGMLHFPYAALDDNTLERQVDVPIAMTVKKTGVYVIEIYQDGVLISSGKNKITAANGNHVNITISNKEASFIKVSHIA